MLSLSCCKKSVPQTRKKVRKREQNTGLKCAAIPAPRVHHCTTTHRRCGCLDQASGRLIEASFSLTRAADATSRPLSIAHPISYLHRERGRESISVRLNDLIPLPIIRALHFPAQPTNPSVYPLLLCPRGLRRTRKRVAKINTALLK